MVQALKSVSVLRSGSDQVRTRLKVFVPVGEAEKVDKIEAVKVDTKGELQPDEIRFTPSTVSPGRYILQFGSAKGKEFTDGLMTPENLHGRTVDLNDQKQEKDLNQDTAYIIEATDRFFGFSNDEQKVYDLLKNISDMLSRVYDRRTNSSAWALLMYLQRLGIEDDGKESVPKKIDKMLKDPAFVRMFTEYLRLKRTDRGKAEAYLQAAFQEDENAEQKKEIAKLSSKIIGISSGLPDWVVSIFPVLFTAQNILMPWFVDEREDSKKGLFSKLANMMVIINPWIGDYFTELLGNLMKEVRGIRSVSNTLFVDNNPRGKNTAGQKDIREHEGVLVDEVKLTDYNHEEYGLQKIVKEVNDASERIFGKNTTLSSLLLNGMLWLFSSKNKNYQKFAAQYVENPIFIKKLCDYLKKGEKANIDEVFKDLPGGSVVSRIILGIVKGVRSISEDTIKKVTSTFGFIYSIQNLFIPILAHVFKRGFLGGLIRFLRRANPPINDLFIDHLGNFRKEILSVLNAKMIHLFPKLDIKLGINGLVQNFKSVLGTIRGFVGNRFNKGVQPGTT